MTYDGKLIVIGARSLSVIDRDFKEAPQTVKFGKMNMYQMEHL